MGESESDRASSYKSMPNGYWNIIFLNSKTNTYHLLSENKMIIRSYNQKYGSDNTERISQTKNYIFYSITSDDFDKDKKLTENDPTYLFISDKEGKKFKQLSPDNYDVVNWQYLKSVNKIVMACKKDSDKNNKFDDEDEIAIFEIDTTSEMGPKEVFSAEFKNHLKILFDRDWKRIKK